MISCFCLLNLWFPEERGRSRESSLSGKETPESESRSESSEDPTWSCRDRQSHSIDMGEVRSWLNYNYIISKRDQKK